MTERRYSEEEVAAIFERAAEAQHGTWQQLSAAEGMTVAELQEIGREVGIPPELVARAARSIDRGGQPASRRFLGFPLAVGHTIDLQRRLTDEEWEQLVVDLRDTFDARGVVRYDGPFRQWTNGNLQALLEPTASGHRLRLRTLNGNARGLMTAGVGLVGIAAAMVLAAAVSGGLTDPGRLGSVAFLSALGAGMFSIGALRLPAWARRRLQQMEAIAGRLGTVPESGSPDDGAVDFTDPTGGNPA